MFRGDYSLKGVSIITNFMIITSFLTIVLLLAQDDTLIIPILDKIQTILCWRTFKEAVFIDISLWCLRHVERIFTTSSFLIFLLYNLICYFPFFIMILIKVGFHHHFSLAYFVPYSNVIYFLWYLPSTSVSGLISDKLIIFVVFGLLILINFPYSIICPISSIIGTIIWSYDVFRFRNLTFHQQLISNNNIVENNFLGAGQLDIEEPNSGEVTNETDIQRLIDMGFTEEEVRSALQQNDNDTERAINQLLSNA